MKQQKERILLASAALTTDNDLLMRVIDAVQDLDELTYVLCCIEMYIDTGLELEFPLIDDAIFTALWRRQRIHTRMDIWLKISQVKEALLDDVVVQCLRMSCVALARYVDQQKYIQIVLSYLKEEKTCTSHLTKILGEE